MQVKMNPSSKVLQRLGLEEYGRVHQKLAKRAADRMDKYVPKDTGTLRDTVRIDYSDCSIHYEQVYAGYQYYGQRKDGTRKIKNHKGITGPYWNKKMMSAEGKDLEKDIMKYYLTGK